MPELPPVFLATRHGAGDTIHFFRPGRAAETYCGVCGQRGLHSDGGHCWQQCQQQFHGNSGFEWHAGPST